MTAPATVHLATGPALSYVEHGDEFGPALVLLPGPTDSWVSYEEVLELLPSSIRALAVSQRGHGDSDKPATGYGIEHFAADVLCLLDTLGIGQAVLAGHSGSCLTARRVALDHPTRVAGLVLEASPATLRGNAAVQEFVRSTISPLDDPIDIATSGLTNSGVQCFQGQSPRPSCARTMAPAVRNPVSPPILRS